MYSSISKRVRAHQFKFVRLPDGELAKIYVLYVPLHGRRRPGRHQSYYLFHIQRLLGDDEITFDTAHIASMAQGRRGWKKIAVTCSAAK